MTTLPANFKGEFTLCFKTFTYTFDHDEPSRPTSQLHRWVESETDPSIKCSTIFSDQLHLHELRDLLDRRIYPLYAHHREPDYDHLRQEFWGLLMKTVEWMEELQHIRDELTEIEAVLGVGRPVRSEMIQSWTKEKDADGDGEKLEAS
ncbi:MAG: hypothetical protein Q9220_003816 [cf. Caloplaca sp. 1 TL-2023]